jgi:outer membrane receptor protein involved in Fe transport
MKKIPSSVFVRALVCGFTSTLAAVVSGIAQTTPPEKASEKADEDVVLLSPFRVESVKDVSYGAASAGSSGRLNQRYLDLPQVTSVVTSQLIADANLHSAIDVLKFVNNVQSRAPAHAPEYVIRGLYSTRNYFDGFYGGQKINFDTFFADRVEVVKGPSSASFGRGDPAGMVNFISKQAFFRNSTELGALIGTGNSDQNNFRVSVDHNAVGGDKREFAYRFLGLHHTGAGTRSLSEFDKNAAMLSMARKLGTRGLLTGSFFWSKENTPASVGNPGFIDPYQLKEFLRRANNTTPNVPLTDEDYTFGYNSDGFAQDMLVAAVTLDYKLTEKLRTRQAFRYTDVDKFGSFGAGNPGSIQRDAQGVYTVSIPLLRDQIQTRGWSYQADFLTDWKMGDSSKFTLLFGGDASDLRDVDARQTAGTPRQPLLAFNRADPPVVFPSIETAGLVNDGSNWGLYSQLQANLFSNKAELTLAGRKQYFDYTSLNRVSKVSRTIDDSTDVIPRVALSLRPTTWLSIYSLWTKHADPGSTVAAFANLPAGDPRLAQTLVVQPETVLKEVGVRASLLDNKHTVSATWFSVKRTGAFSFIVFNEVINGTSFPVETRYLSGEDLTGWEIEAFGKFGKLTYMVNAGGVSGDARIGPAANAVIDPPEISDNASGYLRYSFADPGGDGWSALVGGKVFFSGWNLGNNITSPYPENQWQFDIGVDYVWRKGRYKVGLKTNNVFDERITVGQNMRFDGRLMNLSFIARF